jgi:glycosyltransferase involved in cell wall biosynthesis
MLGWEFPPYFAGGVGIVCYELTKALDQLDKEINIEYVMAYGPKDKQKSSKLKVTSAGTPEELELSNSVKITEVETYLSHYDSYDEYSQRIIEHTHKKSLKSENDMIKTIYGPNILKEMELYAQRVAKSCKDKDFDVIHAHDWTTIPAAILLKKLTGKPIVLHVHITEFDKTGGIGGDPRAFEIEQRGFDAADVIVPVSNFTKLRLLSSYNVDENKIKVIHNGGISDMEPTLEKNSEYEHEKIVLFAGRMTLQKGPEYFLRAAKKVLEIQPHTKFVMIGSGDQLPAMIELARELGISKSVLFHGKYNREEANHFFSIANCFVMPSVSEPFGIVPLEAVAKGTPAIISKQSGISEVLNHSLKVDFWDIEDMAHKIASLITYEPLNTHLREEAYNHFHKFSWETPAYEFYSLYAKLTQK